MFTSLTASAPSPVEPDSILETQWAHPFLEAKLAILLSVCFLTLASIAGCSATHVGLHANLVPMKTMHAEPKVVFMGDSITYNYGQTWASPAFAEHPTWNDQGLVGQNSYQMMSRFEDDVVSQNPQVVVILAGTNDVYPGWELCGGSPVYDTCDNVKSMVQQAKTAGIQPILATIPPWGCPEPNCALAADSDPDAAAHYARIFQLNTWITQYAAQQQLVVIDYHSALVSVDGNTYVPDLTIDGVHPTPAGYDLMTPMVEDAITTTQMK
jgi:lysophospholipase L1-like esterase